MEKLATADAVTKPYIPTIRLNDTDKAATVETLRLACEEVGFFYLEDHGIPTHFLGHDVLEQSKLLFELPLEEKRAMVDSVLNRGYTGMEEETLDPAKQSKGDTKEGFYIQNADVPESSSQYNPSKLCGPNQWPTKDKCPSMKDPDKFRIVMNQFLGECSRVGFRLTQLLALAIGLGSEHFFDDDFEYPLITLRLLHYAREPSDPSAGVYACGAHSDYGMLTLLLTDDNPGLQILTKDSRWIDVPPRPHAFVVNLGDMLERWTNGRFRSTLHRVMTTDTGRERYSIPVFYDPHFDTEVKVLDICTSPDNPPRYPPTTSGQHLLDKYKETHADFEHEGE